MSIQIEHHRVYFPFLPDESRDRALLDGSITATIRPKRLGYPGDTFLIFHLGMYCEIDAVRVLPLGVAALRHYRACGYTSRVAMLADYQRMHPYVGQQLTRNVFVYYFHKIPSPAFKKEAVHAGSV